MKITKSHLKRIILEEYQNLADQGLIKENYPVEYSPSDMRKIVDLLAEGQREFIEQGLLIGEDLGLINKNYPVEFKIKKDTRMFMEKTLEIWTFVTPSLEFIEMLHETKMKNGLGGVGWYQNFSDEDNREDGWVCNLVYRKKHLDE